jgi:Protein of unknown function (DUF1501)
MKRRKFLQTTAGGAAAVAGASVWSRKAKALAFGEAPTDYKNVMLPQAKQAKSILEVFMYGGVSPWESFYCSDTYGKTNKQFLYTFLDRTIEACGRCEYPMTTESELLTPWKTDTSGRQVFLGPFLRPLLDRPDVLRRMRIVINRHALEPHEAAIPLAISGKTLGSPSLASLGAHIQRHFVETGDQARTAPYAYGFATAGGFIPTDNVLSLVATGLHPGAARPLLIKVDNVSRLNTLLDRVTVGSVGQRKAYDDLLNVYFRKYEQDLRFGGGNGDMLRASRYKELAQAAKSVAGSQSIKDVLDERLFTRVPGSSCGVDNDINVPAMSLNLATHLLTHPVSPAKHCCVIDTGLEEADGGGGYDTHSEMTFTQSRNLKNLLSNLLSKINNADEGEADASKINLDDTMVILNQEFGRTPAVQGTFGRNHWPYGYMQVYIGGPITEENSGVYREPHRLLAGDGHLAFRPGRLQQQRNSGPDAGCRRDHRRHQASVGD